MEMPIRLVDSKNELFIAFSIVILFYTFRPTKNIIYHEQKKHFLLSLAIFIFYLTSFSQGLPCAQFTQQTKPNYVVEFDASSSLVPPGTSIVEYHYTIQRHNVQSTTPPFTNNYWETIATFRQGTPVLSYKFNAPNLSNQYDYQTCLNVLYSDATLACQQQQAYIENCQSVIPRP